MSDFGKTPAYPQSVVFDQARDQVTASYAYGAEIGMNMQQHVWLQILCAVLADGHTRAENAKQFADEALPLVLKRLEQLA
ncbi:hypothetical protein [Achromobacter sp. 2789STDY5608621]|uniref:hypothetical protein n=1 Tax=Achromobacter sp. 2789STDY5608621 TaxID=1806496 RepID=UPI0006C51D89|nr:hypothetical protein [Achromobacter sp. 2789STDY5608621]CUI86180.1 Uncharacterised protein [Achromobacter sp. 2789STDY5608621]